MSSRAAARRKADPGALTRAEEAYRQLLGLITEGKLGEGDRLPSETELAAQFAVSRPLIRQALSRLQAAGVVDVRWGAGSFVRDSGGAAEAGFGVSAVQSLNDVRHLFELRITLEGDAATLAAERRTEDGLQAIGHALKALDDVLRTGRVGNDADMAFHFAVADASLNPMFGRMLRSLRRSLVFSMGLARSLALTHPVDRVRTVQAEHVTIADAIRAREPQAAKAAMQAHLRNSCQRMFLGPGHETG
jgi:DNA-binding FadR family transcriptional regulator